MIKRNSHNGFEESPSNTSATSPLVHSKGETGALRSSVFEINKSSSIVNFITHVWSCCSDLLFAEMGLRPRRSSVDSEESSWPLLNISRTIPFKILAEFFNGIEISAETKHVSVIDDDRSLEVRC